MSARLASALFSSAAAVVTSLIAPQLTSRQLDEEVGLGQQPGFGIATGNHRHFLLQLIQLFGQRLLLMFGFV